MKDQISDAAMKATPPGLVVAWNSLSTIPAEKWVTYLTIAYVILQVVVLVRKEFFKRSRSARRQPK